MTQKVSPYAGRMVLLVPFGDSALQSRSEVKKKSVWEKSQIIRIVKMAVQCSSVAGVPFVK